MTMVVPLGWQVLDASGNPYSGAKANFYATGTTTPQATYSNAALSTPNANPLVADAAGRFGPAYGPTTTDYKVVLTTSADVVIATYDPVQMTGSVAALSVDSAQLVNNSVTNAKLADMATASIKGRTTAGTGDPQDLTALQVATLLGTLYKFPSVSLTGAAQADFAFDPTVYRAIVFFYDAVVMTSDGAALHALVSIDSGSNFISTAGSYNAARGVADATPAINGVGGTDTKIIIAAAVDSTASQNLSGFGVLIIGSAAAHATKILNLVGYQSTAIAAAFGYGSNSTASQVNAVRFVPSASTFASGNIHAYGILK